MDGVLKEVKPTHIWERSYILPKSLGGNRDLTLLFALGNHRVSLKFQLGRF